MQAKGDYILIETFYFFRRIFYRKQVNDKKNIMVLIYHLRNGGAERVAANLCDELSKKHNVIMVTLDEKTDLDYPCIVKREVLVPSFNKYCNYLYYVSQIKRLKKRYNIDCSIASLRVGQISSPFSSPLSMKVSIFLCKAS